jgi:hypothetical protein
MSKEKRVLIDNENIKRLRLIITLDDNLSNLTEKDAINTIINKAIKHYFESDEIQEQFKKL